jgi:hypothetical protein
LSGVSLRVTEVPCEKEAEVNKAINKKERRVCFKEFII